MRFPYLVSVLIRHVTFAFGTIVPLWAEPCPIRSVSDGDTVTAVCSGIVRHIRVSSIDAPERKQVFGPEAKRFTSDLVLDKQVDVDTEDWDKYGRMVARITLADGRDLGRELVAAGYAWHYLRYSKDAALAHLEVTARAARTGLWSELYPEPPSTYRKAIRDTAAFHSSRGGRRSERRSERRSRSVTLR